MARPLNSLNLEPTFNVLGASPIDSRMRVEHESDLTSPSTWPITGAPVFDGMMVSVIDTGEIWVLKDVNYSGDTESGNGWVKQKGTEYEAGDNIIISGGTISAVDTTYIAGDYISISGNTISADGLDDIFRTISSNINELSEKVDEKQNVLVEGDNIEISTGGTISAVNTWRSVTVNDTEILGNGTDTGSLVLSAGTNVTLTTDNGAIIINSSGGGEPSIDTWRQIKLNNTEILGTATSTNPLNIITGSNISIENVDGNLTISATDTTYSNGTGVTISDNKISANSDATTIDNIALSNGAPINALGIWENDIIPSGTSIQVILEKLLNRELFPNAATKPSFTIGNGAIGVVEYKTGVTLTAPSTTTSNGKYNASFTSPAQPNVAGVSWTNETVSGPTIISGFTGSGSEKTIEIGENKASYTYSKTYSAPSNMPITNQNHQTQSTTKVSTDGSDISAIWASSSITQTGYVTATGVYPCFTNISGTTLIDDINQKCDLTAGNELIINNVPSEVISNKFFKFAFPIGRTVTYKIETTNQFVDYTGSYTTGVTTNFYNGVNYVILSNSGEIKQGPNKYKMILSKNLNS